MTQAARRTPNLCLANLIPSNDVIGIPGCCRACKAETLKSTLDYPLTSYPAKRWVVCATCGTHWTETEPIKE